MGTILPSEFDSERGEHEGRGRARASDHRESVRFPEHGVELDHPIWIVRQPGMSQAWPLTTHHIPEVGAFLRIQQFHETGHDSKVLHASVTTPTMKTAAHRTDLIGNVCIGEVLAVTSFEGKMQLLADGITRNGWLRLLI